MRIWRSHSYSPPGIDGRSQQRFDLLLSAFVIVLVVKQVTRF
ncbi:MAG: hypothetical protein SGJ16_05650 [Nitrospirota bacterium]|nr:hypothetical protein [Nitrospirota bacterium]